MTFVTIQICIAIFLLFIIGLIYKVIRKKINNKFSMYFLIIIVFFALLFLVINEINTSGFTDLKVLVFLPLIVLSIILLIINAIKSKNI
ncbi:hypothetical protein CQZ94_26535 [Bacillus sp. MYb209]|nr:hypothetical protein CQZ94_26535 [Bacillus sp. MYb209]